MTDKEKGKFNPFIQMLHQDEEILWLHRPEPLTRLQHLKRYLMVCVAFILPFYLLLYVLPFPMDRWISDFFLRMSSAIYLIVPILFLMGLVYPISWFLRQREVVSGYAVTNQRILSYSSVRVTARNLEEIDVLQSHKHTISFGWAFEKWGNVEESDEVVSLIEQARDARLSGLKET